MKRLGIVAALLGVAFVIYGVAFPSATIRYRLTLEARVDGTPAFGSGVIEVTYSKQSDFASQHELTYDFRGEAVVLDLGARGPLFALLKEGSDVRSGPEWIVLRAFGFPGGAFPSPVADGMRKVRQLTGRRDLPLTNLPLLVRFRDLNDPKTVERVDPLDLASTFGAGVELVRATLEVVSPGLWSLSSLGLTGEAITTGIVSRLNWLPKYYNLQFDGERYEVAGAALPLANSLASGAFRAGL